MKVPIHISIPYNLLKEIDAEAKNRSKWIVDACRGRMSDEHWIEEQTIGVLKAKFHARTCGCHHTDSCPYWMMLGLIVKDTESS